MEASGHAGGRGSESTNTEVTIEINVVILLPMPSRPSRLYLPLVCSLNKYLATGM